MPIEAGTYVGHYQVVALLGVGGMGEVYRARDTTLGRDVALKVLPDRIASDPDRRARFDREAQVLASLNHPHIAQIHGIAGDGDVRALVMELVEGPTLRDRITAGPLPLRDALNLARQIADALDAAHAKGIVHRDLKPENVKLTASGEAKVLDFGLAKRFEAAARDQAHTGAPTLTATSPGVVLGTPAYMSPEQARGEDVTTQTDIWAFGCLVYAMLTGGAAFARPSGAETLAAILEKEPDWTRLPPDVPAALRRLLERCVERDRRRRLHHIGDARIEIEEVISNPGGSTGAARPSSRRLLWPLGAVAVGVAVLAGMATINYLGRRDTGGQPDVWSVVPPADTTLTEGEAPQISADGRAIVFIGTNTAGQTRLYVRDVGTANPRVLPETDDASQPFWSPDGQAIGFFARGSLKTIRVIGGRPQTLAPAPVPRGGSWNRDDIILFVPFPEQPLHRISVNGGKATPVASRDAPGVYRWFPWFLPDGRHYLYLAFDLKDQERTVVRVGSLDSTETSEVIKSIGGAVFVEPGYVLFRKDESLFALGFDSQRLVRTGSPVRLLERVSMNPVTNQALFSASGTRLMAYLGTGHGWQFDAIDRTGRPVEDASTSAGTNSLCLTSDDRHVVHDVADSKSGTADIVSFDRRTGNSAQLTFDAGTDFYPICSPKSEEIIFASTREGPPTLYRMSLSEPGGEKPLLPPTVPNLPTDWSPDGRFVVYSAFSPQTDWDIWVLPLDGGKPFPYIATPAAEKNGHLSPDGRWMAYTSDESVYVQAFPTAGTTKWPISQAKGGRQPQWAPDGRQLFYLSLDKKLMSVDIQTSGPTFQHGMARAVADTRASGLERAHQGNPYDITSDGQRFLINNARGGIVPITVVRNWTALTAPIQ